MLSSRWLKKKKRGDGKMTNEQMTCETKLNAIESIIRDFYADKTTTLELAILKIARIVVFEK
jgi:hypothetical protein